MFSYNGILINNGIIEQHNEDFIIKVLYILEFDTNTDCCPRMDMHPTLEMCSKTIISLDGDAHTSVLLLKEGQGNPCMGVRIMHG